MQGGTNARQAPIPVRQKIQTGHKYETDIGVKCRTWLKWKCGHNRTEFVKFVNTYNCII